MTTIEAQLSLMDWLRTNVGIGVGCVDRDGPDSGHHLAEQCQEELDEYRSYFGAGLREAGPVGELVYFTIRQAAKNARLLHHAEDYAGPVMQGRVRDYLI